MQYLAIFTPKAEFTSKGMPADFPQRELEEQAQTRALYASGVLRQVWAKVPKEKGAIVLFEADSPEHLQKMIHSFPLIKMNYADYRTLQLAPDTAFATKAG